MLSVWQKSYLASISGRDFLRSFKICSCIWLFAYGGEDHSLQARKTDMLGSVSVSHGCTMGGKGERDLENAGACVELVHGFPID